MSFRFIVDLPPMGKERPRMARSGHVYTPKKTVDAEKLIADTYGWLTFDEPEDVRIPKGEPARLVVTAYFPIPKSFTKEQRQKIAEGKLFPAKKPDADNVLKLVGDALNGVAYDDDAQVVDARCLKRYSLNGQAYMVIEIGGWDDEVGT